LIEYTFTGFQTTITGNGLGLTLQTSRVAQASDIVNLPYSLDLRAGARVWVDNDGSGRWEVLEKTNPFTEQITFSPVIPESGSLYGSSVAQGYQNLSALVGAPGYNFYNAGTAPGAVYTYVKTQTDQYEENSILQLGTTDAAGYGNDIAIGNQQWAVIGASASNNSYGYAAVIYRNPASNVFEQQQLLVRDVGDVVTSNDEFGYSVTISRDERCIYVGAPGGNRVYAYERVDVPFQYVEYIADGNSIAFNYSNSIIVDNGTQMVVVVNNVLQNYGVDWNVSGNNIAFSSAPLQGSEVIITRRTTENFVGDGSTTTFDVSTVYTAVSAYSTTVYINQAIQRPLIDYTVDGLQNLIFVNPPGIEVEIEVLAETYFTPVHTFEDITLSGNERFGQSVHTSTDGRQLAVGCPVDSYTDPVTSTAYPGAGSLYVYDRGVQRFQVTDSAIVEYTTVQSLTATTQVTQNGVFLVNNNGNIDGNFSISGNTVTLNVNPAVGDILEIETNEFSQVQKLYANTPETAARFGYTTDLCTNDCSLYTSAPYMQVGPVLEAGAVDFNINQARIFGIITSTIANPVLTIGQY
jgi:hypothetical protein